MYRTRFIFGVSVLFLAAGMTACQGRGDAPKPTQTTPAPKTTTSTKKTTKPPAKAATPSAQAQHHTPPANAKTPPAPAPAPIAKTAPPNAAPAKTPVPQQATLPASDKATTPAKPITKPTDKTPAAAKVIEKPMSKPADTRLAKADQTKATPPPSSAKAAAGTSTTTLTAVQEQIKQNANLAAKIASRLPTGTDVVKAAEGFGNLGQFVAAVNASSNLQLSFTDLKAKLIDGKMSLSQAIQAARPLTASPTIEAQRAEYDARGMIAESEQQPSQTAGASTGASKKGKR